MPIFCLPSCPLANKLQPDATTAFDLHQVRCDLNFESENRFNLISIISRSREVVDADTSGAQISRATAFMHAMTTVHKPTSTSALGRLQSDGFQSGERQL